MDITVKDLYDMSMLDSVEVPGEVVEDWESGTSIKTDSYTMTVAECTNLRLCLLANDEDPTNDARVLELHDATDDDPAMSALVNQVADCTENFRYDDDGNVIGVVKGRKVKDGIKVYLRHAPKKFVVMKKLKGRSISALNDEKNAVTRTLKMIASSMGITFNSILTLRYGDYQQCQRAFNFLMNPSPEKPG